HSLPLRSGFPKFLFLSAVFLAFVVSASPASAQTQASATLRAVITDPSDAAVSGATALLQRLARAAAAGRPASEKPLRVDSTREGSIEVSAPPGRYRLTVSYPGLHMFEQTLTLAPGENREVSVHLTIEPLSSAVVVSAEALPEAAAAASEPVDIVTRPEID